MSPGSAIELLDRGAYIPLRQLVTDAKFREECDVRLGPFGLVRDGLNILDVGIHRMEQISLTETRNQLAVNF